MYKYAVQNLHRKQVHVNSVPRHYKPSEILTAIGEGAEARSSRQVDRSAGIQVGRLFYFLNEMSTNEQVNNWVNIKFQDRKSTGYYGLNS